MVRMKQLSGSMKLTDGSDETTIYHNAITGDITRGNNFIKRMWNGFSQAHLVSWMKADRLQMFYLLNI